MRIPFNEGIPLPPPTTPLGDTVSVPVNPPIGTQQNLPALSPDALVQQAAVASSSDFNEGFNESYRQDRDAAVRETAIQSLATRLREEFQDAENSRSLVNLRWLDDLRQYRGIYDDTILDKMKCCKSGSRAFYRLTTAKVNTMVARLMDLLFPQRIKNWSLEATPDPDIPLDVIAEDFAQEIQAQIDSLIQTDVQQALMQGISIPPEQIQVMAMQYQQQVLAQYDTQENRVRVAKERAKKMEQVIDDQLKEGAVNGTLRPSWRQNCRQVIKSACLYGMGVLKGPLIEKIDVTRYTTTGMGQWKEEVYKTEFRPFHEAVSIWEVYPDPGARVPSELRYVWQRHLKTDKDLRELLQIPGFDRGKILKYIKDFPEGDAELATWEEQVRQLNSDNGTNGGNRRLQNRYTLLERWGYLTGQELYNAGLEIAQDDLTEVFSTCVWMLGDVIIKASINPIEGVDIPYYFYPYQSDETSFWPEGIAYQLRTPQACINAAVRAIQDNTRMTSGPIIGVNVANISDRERLDDMQAGKVFLFDRPETRLSDCLQTTTIPSAISEGLSLINFWSNVADEVSTPRFNQGDGSIQGAGETASGLSMLMGASNILLKDHVKDFDDNVVSPFIRALFKWNMKWNTRADIKGDFEVVASGSQSLIAKEVRAQQIPILIQYLQIPQFQQFLKPKELLEVALEQTDLPAERILRTEDEANQYQQDMLMQQAQAEVQALMQQLQQSGMTPEQIQQQLMIVLGQSVAQLNSGQKGTAPMQPPMPSQGQSSAKPPQPMQGPDVPPAPPEMSSMRQLPIRGPVNEQV